MDAGGTATPTKDHSGSKNLPALVAESVKGWI